MVSNNSGGISQSVSGGTVHGGMQAALGNDNQQTMSSNVTEGTKILTQVEIAELLAQLESMISQSKALSDADRSKAVQYLGAAKVEAEEEEPNKQLVATNLERVTKTLQAADQTVEAGRELWQEAIPVVKEIAKWLGTAAKALWVLLP